MNRINEDEHGNKHEHEHDTYTRTLTLDTHTRHLHYTLYTSGDCLNWFRTSLHLFADLNSKPSSETANREPRKPIPVHKHNYEQKLTNPLC